MRGREGGRGREEWVREEGRWEEGKVESREQDWLRTAVDGFHPVT